MVTYFLYLDLHQVFEHVQTPVCGITDLTILMVVILSLHIYIYIYIYIYMH